LEVAKQREYSQCEIILSVSKYCDDSLLEKC
jgi:hypothetical protein